MSRKIFSSIILVVLFFSQLIWRPLVSQDQMTATPTATLIPSSQQTTEKPAPYSNAYTLRNWTEEEALNAVKAVDIERFRDVDDLYAWEPWEKNHPYNQEDYEYAYLVANREFLLRFPQSPIRNEIYPALANLSPNMAYWDYFSSSFHVIDPVLIMLDEAINQGQTTPENIGEWFKQNKMPITVEKRISSNHLFGKGKPGEVFNLDMEGFWKILLVIQGGKPGEYRLHTIKDDWSMTFQDSWTIKADNFTGNGQTDIAILHTWHGSGIAHVCTQATEIYQWDGQKFQDVAKMVDNFSISTDFGECGGWDLLPGPNESKIIASKEIVYNEACYITANLVHQNYYQWDGIKYVWTGNEVLPYKLYKSSLCATGWASIADPENRQAVEIMAGTINSWPAELNNIWGPAAEDYFRYRLGVWYAMRGAKEEAVKYLEQVRDQPSVPKFSTASQIASAFLEEYQKTGVYAGCKAVIQSLHKEFDAFQFPLYYGGYADYDVGQMQDTWGFGIYDWAVNDRIFSPGGSSSGICSLNQAFQLSIQQSSITSQASLLQWLSRNEVPVINTKEGDIDGDGINDWLVLLRMDEIRLLALIRQGDMVLPVEVPIGSYSDDVATAWRTFKASPTSGQKNAYLADGVVYIFTVDPKNGGHAQIENTFYSIRFLDVRGTSPNQKIALFHNDGRTVFLEWNNSEHSLILTSTNPGQDEMVGMIEKSIFIDQDPVQAQEWIETLIRTGIKEQPRYGDKNVARIKPYLLYMLGLSYEMTGQADKAVHAYWQLWDEFPTNPYTIIAKMKLVK